MLDTKIRPLIDPSLDKLGGILVSNNISANSVTLIGFIFGLCAFASLIYQNYLLALIFLALSRLMDGLDGSVARRSELGPTDKGAYLDIVTDMIFYAGFPLFFALGRPEFMMEAAFLLFSFIGTASSFLAYAIIKTKHGAHNESNEKKSFHYASGLCEGTETIFFFTLFCLLPNYFGYLALTFALLCWITVIGRIMRAMHEFK